MQKGYLYGLVAVVWGKVIYGMEKWQREEKEKEIEDILDAKSTMCSQLLAVGLVKLDYELNFK